MLKEMVINLIILNEDINKLKIKIRIMRLIKIMTYENKNKN